METALEEELRERVWGDRRLHYEKNQTAFRETKAALYSPELRERMEEFDCMAHPMVDRGVEVALCTARFPAASAPGDRPFADRPYVQYVP